jgi:hypothetical protein
MNIKQEIERSVVECLRGKDINEVLKIEKDELKKIWGKENENTSTQDTKTSLADIAIALSKEFKKEISEKCNLFHRIFKKNSMEMLIECFGDVIDVCLIVNMAFTKIEQREENINEKKETEKFINMSKIRIDVLQNQCNRLILIQQRRQFLLSLIIALASIIIAVYSYVDANRLNKNNAQKDSINYQIYDEIRANIDTIKYQCLSDSIRFNYIQDSINKLIEQNNEIIKKMPIKLKTKHN